MSRTAPPAPAGAPPPEAARERSRVIEASPVYYGWVILAAAVLGVVMTTPGQTVGVSVFLDSIIEDVGLPRSTVSLTYLIGTLGGALALPFVGRWIDRRGPRLAVTLIAALFALACIGMGRVRDGATLALGFTAIRGLGQGALGLVCTHVVNLWFVRRRGLAIGVLGIGMALASAFSPVLIQRLIHLAGWRNAYALLGLIVAATILPIGYAFFRERPERFGLLPDGRNGSGDGPVPVAERDWTLAEARRTPLFWTFLAGGFLTSALGTGLIFHHFSIMELNGLDRSAAAVVFVPISAVAAAATLSSGVLIDRFQPRTLLPVALVCLAAALVTATRVSSPQTAWVYGATLGVMQGMQGAVAGTAWAYYFGRAHHAAIKGFAFTVLVGGAAFGPLPFAWGLEWTGGYGSVLAISAVLPLFVALIACLVPSPRPPAADPGAA